MCVSHNTLLLPVVLLTLLLTIVPGQPVNTLPSSVEPVQLHITVTGKNDAFVDRLKRDNFEVVVDKIPASIVSFGNQDAPSSVGIVLDSSGSVGSRSPEKTRREFLMVRDAIDHFLSQSNPSNEYFLLGFNLKPQLLTDWTSTHSELLDGFNDLIIYGPSAFYDSSYVAVNKLLAGRHQKRVLLLIGDGQDNVSRYTFNQLRELIRNSGVIVYSIYFSGQPAIGSALGEEGRSILREFSVVSGGRVYLEAGHPIKPKELTKVLEAIANELRHQYSMTIVPGETGGARKWRKIKTVVKSATSNEKIRSRTREGFYSGRPKTD